MKPALFHRDHLWVLLLILGAAAWNASRHEWVAVYVELGSLLPLELLARLLRTNN